MRRTIGGVRGCVAAATQDYVETLGVNFMEKSIPTDDTEVRDHPWMGCRGSGVGCQRGHCHCTQTASCCTGAQVTMSIWDLGGDRTYLSMLPMGKRAATPRF